MISNKNSNISAKKIIIFVVIAFFILDIIVLLLVSGQFFDNDKDSSAEAKPEPTMEKRVAIDSTAEIISPEDFPPSYHLEEGKLEVDALDTDKLLLIDDIWETAYQDLDLAFKHLTELDEYEIRAFYWCANIENGDYNNGKLYPILKFRDNYNVYYSVSKQILSLPIPNEFNELTWDDYNNAYYQLPKNEYNELDLTNKEPLAFTLPTPDSFASFSEGDKYIAIYDDYSKLEKHLISMIREAYIVKEFYFDGDMAEYKISPLIKSDENNSTIYDDFTITLRHYLKTDKVYIEADANDLFMSAFALQADTKNEQNHPSNHSNVDFSPVIVALIFFVIFGFVLAKSAKSTLNKIQSTKNNMPMAKDDYYQTANDYSQQKFEQQEFAEHSYDDVNTYEEHRYIEGSSYEAYYQQEIERVNKQKRQMSTKDKNGPFWIDD